VQRVELRLKAEAFDLARTLGGKLICPIGRALRKGILVRPSKCQRCNKRRKVHAHHDDYTKPLDVNWLCSRCHGRLHSEVEG